MDVPKQREAIYEAETAIEAALDKLRADAGLTADKIEIQTLVDHTEQLAVHSVKVNIRVHKIHQE